MKSPKNKVWSANSMLAGVAIFLGALALLGSATGGSVHTVNSRELADMVERKVDHVSATELADWILQGSTDYRLIDIREPEAYARYHIPTAENVSITELSDYPLYRNEKIVLYSDGGIHSAQGWFLLKANRFNGAYILLGGLDFWKDEVLFPEPPLDATPEAALEFAKESERSRYFGGSPRSDSGVETASAEVAMPTPAPATVIAQPKKRKKRKGC